MYPGNKDIAAGKICPDFCQLFVFKIYLVEGKASSFHSRSLHAEIHLVIAGMVQFIHPDLGCIGGDTSGECSILIIEPETRIAKKIDPSAAVCLHQAYVGLLAGGILQVFRDIPGEETFPPRIEFAQKYPDLRRGAGSGRLCGIGLGHDKKAAVRPEDIFAQTHAGRFFWPCKRDRGGFSLGEGVGTHMLGVALEPFLPFHGKVEKIIFGQRYTAVVNVITFHGDEFRYVDPFFWLRGSGILLVAAGSQQK